MLFYVILFNHLFSQHKRVSVSYCYARSWAARCDLPVTWRCCACVHVGPSHFLSPFFLSDPICSLCCNQAIVFVLSGTLWFPFSWLCRSCSFLNHLVGMHVHTHFYTHAHIRTRTHFSLHSSAQHNNETSGWFKSWVLSKPFSFSPLSLSSSSSLSLPPQLAFFLSL